MGPAGALSLQLGRCGPYKVPSDHEARSSADTRPAVLVTVGCIYSFAQLSPQGWSRRLHVFEGTSAAAACSPPPHHADSASTRGPAPSHDQLVTCRLEASGPVSVLSHLFGRLGFVRDHRVSRGNGGRACGQEPRSRRIRLRPPA